MQQTLRNRAAERRAVRRHAPEQGRLENHQACLPGLGYDVASSSESAFRVDAVEGHGTRQADRVDCVERSSGSASTEGAFSSSRRADDREVVEVFGELLAQRIAGGRGQIILEPTSYLCSDSIDGSTWLRPGTTGQRWLAARGKSKLTFAMPRRYVATQLLDVTNGDYRTVASITGNSEEIHCDAGMTPGRIWRRRRRS